MRASIVPRTIYCIVEYDDTLHICWSRRSLVIDVGRSLDCIRINDSATRLSSSCALSFSVKKEVDAEASSSGDGQFHNHVQFHDRGP